MGYLTESSKRYRTREQMVGDTVIILSSKLSHGMKYDALDITCWRWTEFFGKHVGCPYWTIGARDQYHKNIRSGDFVAQDLRHEHIVPKAVVIDMLTKLEVPTADAVRQLFDELLIGVVVSLDENKRLNFGFGKSMPPGFHEPTSPNYRKPWLRYVRQDDIKVLRLPPQWKAWPENEITVVEY